MSDWNEVPCLTLASALGLFQPLDATLTALSGKTLTGTGNIVLATAPTIANPVITGGSINNTPIGGTTPAAGAFTTGAFSGDLTLSGAPGKIKPAANSTTALQIANAAGTAFASWDTTNLRLGIRVTPTRSFGVGAGVANQQLNIDDTGLYFTRTVDGGENAIIGRDAAQSTTNSVALRYLAARHGFLVGATEMMVLSTSAAAVGAAGVLSIDEIANVSTITTPSNAGLLMTNDQAAATANGQIFNRTNRAAQTSALFITTWQWNSTTQMTVANNGAVVINEQGNDADARIEGDTDANLFFVDASTDRVGIGTATPNSKLDVVGTVQADGLRLDVTPTAETIVPTHTITISVNGTNYKIPLVAA